MLIRRGTKPWSPRPWTVGGKRTTAARTPRSTNDRAIASEGPRPRRCRIVLGRPGRPGGDDEGPVGAGQHLAHRLDGAGVGRSRDLAQDREVVVVGVRRSLQAALNGP